MRNKKSFFVCCIFTAIFLFLFAFGFAQASTVTLISPQLFGSQSLVFYDASGTVLCNGALVRIGYFASPSSLNVGMSVAEMETQGQWTGFGSVAVSSPFGYPGKVYSTAINNTTDATFFNGKPLYVWVFDTANVATATSCGIFRATAAQVPWSFPANGFGVADSVTLNIDDPSIQTFRGIGGVNLAQNRLQLAAFHVSVPPPVLTTPSNITVSATGNEGAVVAYNVTANDTTDGSLIPTCTPVSGSTFPIGTTLVNCSASNSVGGTSSASFTVTVLRSFAAFQDEYGLSSPDPMADPNHTGVCNLVAYAFGVDPSAPDRSQLPSVGLERGYLQISYPRWKDAGDLVYVVEVSSDLLNWESGALYTQQVSVTPIDVTREQVVERDLIPISSASHRFIRVRITH